MTNAITDDVYAYEHDKKEKMIYPELSYKLTGILFETHNSIGRFGREKQYCDFIVDDKIILEAKTMKMLTKDDYYQVQRYLQAANIKLGILANFSAPYLTPKRIIKIDK